MYCGFLTDIYQNFFPKTMLVNVIHSIFMSKSRELWSS